MVLSKTIIHLNRTKLKDHGACPRQDICQIEAATNLHVCCSDHINCIFLYVIFIFSSLFHVREGTNSHNFHYLFYFIIIIYILRYFNSFLGLNDIDSQRFWFPLLYKRIVFDILKLEAIKKNFLCF